MNQSDSLLSPAALELARFRDACWSYVSGALLGMAIVDTFAKRDVNGNLLSTGDIGARCTVLLETLVAAGMAGNANSATALVIENLFVLDDPLFAGDSPETTSEEALRFLAR